ncbi:hypothetical protein [Propionivibrio sp.]|uniref:hypothetical protein n=1 Tax=Propionivibrio sp. TaxID=2212460 RepID=UPI003BF2E118
MNTQRLRYLPQWIDVLATHVGGWALARPLKARNVESLPPPLLLLALRGEGVLRTRYCDWAATSPLTSAPDQVLALWSALWEEGAEIQQLCERIGLSRLASEQAAIPVPTWSVQRSLYACFIASLAAERRQDLLLLATDKLFALALARQFPAAAAAPERVTLATLQQRAHTHIQKALAQPVKLRERFSVEENAAHFGLRVAVNKGDWQELLICQGPRLKPLKRQGYQAVLALDAGALRAKLLDSSRAG